MKARVAMLTLGVDDFERAVAFFDLQKGLRLALWPRSSLAHDAGIEVTSPVMTYFSIGYNVRTEADAVMDRARRTGATIVKAAERTLWSGYAGYFSDPDAHLCEIVFNPSDVPED